MSSDIRFVLDTNEIISALLLKTSVSRMAFDKARNEGDILLSAAVLSELNATLSRKDFSRYVLAHERIQFLAALVRDAQVIDVTETVHECRDPKDDKFLDLIVSGRASCLVSGDEDILALHPFRGIPILRPRSFLDFSARGGAKTQ